MKRWISHRTARSYLLLIFLLTVKCDDKNKPSPTADYDPCKTMSRMIVHCSVNSPGEGASVNPAKIILNWIATTPNPTYTLFLGTSADNLKEISKQTENTYELVNLNLNTTYYWRVDAVNSCKYGCSTGIRSFITVSDINLPAVITTPAITHIYSPPRLGGNVKNEGSSGISDRGIFISLYSNPENTGTKYQIDKGMGLFSDLIPGLTPNTTYFAKAFAVNNSGISFGNEISFSTGSISDYQSIKDIDGNIYYAIKIGEQTWLSENLRATRFNDGTEIPNITTNSEWSRMTTPAYCFYYNNPGYKTTYGALYNWYTVDTASNGQKNVCPSGWHVPVREEYSTLVAYLGGESLAGIKLKEKGESYWKNYSPTSGDNSSGFSALPGGLRYGESDASYQQFYLMESVATWWSSTGPLKAVSMETGYNQSGAYIYDFHNKRTGVSVRCIKDTR